MSSNNNNLFPLSCPLCCQTNFQTVESFKMGLIKVASRPLKCPLCEEIVLGLDKLTIHLFAHSLPNEDQHIVVTTPKNSTHELKSVRKKTKVKAVVTKNENNNKVFKTNQSECLSDCTKIEDSTIPLHQCEICNLSFKNENLLEMHMKLVHEVNGNENLESSDFKYRCNLCTKSFKMKGSLRIHLKVAHYGFHMKSQQRLDVNPTDINDAKCGGSTSIESHINTNNDTSQPYDLIKNSLPKSLSDNNTCDICGKSFTTKYFLKKHKRLHTGEQPYTCNICQKSFTFQQSYHKHLLYHNDEKPHICSVCNRAFKELSTLHNHERIHSGEKPFKCETCGKCFRQRVSYLVHRRIHTGVMPYCCTACNKTFRYKVSQRTHKCTVQPPGTVVRQTGDLLQKLLNNVNLNFNSQPKDDLQLEQTTMPMEDPIAKSLDDLVNESCNKMGLEQWTNAIETNLPETVLNVPSPSEYMKNLCLTSDDRYMSELESTVNTDTLKELLYNVKN